jgi:myo-inositol-1(or 4)-monophosphatase
MKVQRTPWIDILQECTLRLKKRIKPLLSNLDSTGPDMGFGAGGDRLEKVDLAAEKAILDTLERHSVSFTLISEESGTQTFGNRAAECFVTTDPIDGSTNLVHHIPFYATSIAVSTEPFLQTVHSALVADLFHGATYTAEKGKGSFRNGHRIIPSMNVSLEEAVLGMDVNSYKIEGLIARLNEVILRTKHIRHLGANALELCYVADGTTDAFIDIRGKLRSTDMAGAWLIIEEAGAMMTTSEGEPLKIRLDPREKVEFVASGNLELHMVLLDLIGARKE